MVYAAWYNQQQYTLGTVAKLVSEVGELGDNVAKERDVTDDIGDCLVVLNNLAIMNDTTLEECLRVAYNDIKDRKGHMNSHGVFIKEGDAA
jgi:NTP pyrophosphatase (non-canonical NTP hydrolase)